MQNERRRLPSLDLIRGFEAAARHLSFTRAAVELHVTQSAVSRQIKALEEHLGVVLFRRLNRTLLLTDAGQTLYRTAIDVLKRIDETTARLAGDAAGRMLAVSTTVSFASLWLVPRLAAFRKLSGNVDVRISADDAILNLQREQIDLAIRFCEPGTAPAGAIALFGEEVFPVCSKVLVRDRARPLKKPADLANHVLLHFDDPGGRAPWLHWSQWFAAMRLAELRPAGMLRFSHYDQLIRAAIDGEGVALGRSPLVKRLIGEGQLVAPFTKKTVSSRQYFVIVSADAAERPEVKRFVDWLFDEAKRDTENG